MATAAEARMTARLAPADVLLAFADPERLDGNGRAANLPLLSAEEKERAARFVFAKDQALYVASHALLRRTLSRCAPVHAADWRFTADSWCRPRILAPSVEPPLEFNLSNTEGLVGCAVAAARVVGLDIERIRRDVPWEAAEQCLARSELAELRSSPAARQAERFLEYWTLKESYVKARGLGLQLPLRRIAFRIEGGEAPAGFDLDPTLGDDAANWTFVLLRPTPQHVGAICLPTDVVPANLTLHWDDFNWCSG